MNFSLFEEPRPVLAELLAPRLQTLAAEGIFIGTSSWKYEGWLNSIYSRERYVVRGRFSRKKFDAECLAEYAETFPIVCGDFSFYQFPSDAFWLKLFSQAPSPLKFAFKVPEEITVKRFPTHDRYGPRAGQPNEAFLNPSIFAESFLRPLMPFAERVSVMIFEFGMFAKSSFDGQPPFLAQLDAFLGSLPRNRRYAVEVRNPEFLDAEYFACLASHGAAHVFNAWTRMPELGVQMAIADAFTTNFTVVRALLRKGRPYEDAVREFQPYQRIQDPNPPARNAIRELIGRARGRRESAFIFVNNRLEGNAPETIAAITGD